MNNIAIVTDYGASLTREEKFSFEILDFGYVITQCGDSFYTEGDAREVISEKNDIDFLPKRYPLSYTRPNFADWANTIKSKFERGQDILYISSSQKITHNIDVTDAYYKLISKEFPNRKLIYFDSKMIGRAAAYLVKEAVKLNREGVMVEEILSSLLTIKNNVKTIWIPDRKQLDEISFPNRYGALTHNEEGEIISDKSFSSQQEMNNYYENTFKNWDSVDISYIMPDYHRTKQITSRNDLLNFQNITLYDMPVFIFYSLGINAVEYTFIKK